MKVPTNHTPRSATGSASTAKQPGSAQDAAAANRAAWESAWKQGAQRDQRREPGRDPTHENSSFVPPFGAAAPASKYAKYSSYPPRRRLGWLPLFVLLLGLAFAAAWWNEQGGFAVFGARPQPVQGDVTVLLPKPGAVVSSRKGIAASELPYDGLRPPPPAATSRAIAAAERPEPVATRAPRLAAASASRDGETEEAKPQHPAPVARKSAADKAAADQGGSRASSRVAVQSSGANGGSGAAGPGSSESKPKSKQPAASDGVRTAKSGTRGVSGSDDKAAAKATEVAKAKDRQARARKQAAGQRNAERLAKSREIERIKRQATEELKSKSERQKSGQTGRSSASKEADKVKVTRGKPLSKQALLAQCEGISHLIRREQCKWRVCGGSWGQNGCPSYDKPATFY